MLVETAEVGCAAAGVGGSYFFSYWMVLRGGNDWPLLWGVIGRGVECCTEGA